MQETKKTVHCSANADGENHVWPAEKLISRRSFAGSGGALENVLEIVYDLITQSPAGADAIEQLQLAWSGASSYGRKDECERDQRDRLSLSYALGGV